MNGKQKILTAVLQNAEMGTTTIRQIYPTVINSALKTELKHQLGEYSKQSNTVNTQMANLGLKGKSITPTAITMAKMGVRMNLMKDNSTSHIAEMLIQGTNMGIVAINKALNHSQVDDDKIKSNAEILLKNEQNYINRLKKFL